MSEIKNKIITISGEPVSGKSTVVKKLKERYENMGYNVHVVLTGHVFRDVITREYRKMYPDRINANLADIQTDEKFASKRNEIDKMVDDEMAKKGEEINSKDRPNDVYIIDSRLAWKNIPSSFAVRLTIDEKIAGERAFADTTRGKEDRYETVDEATRKTRQRKFGEIERYKERYGVDLTNPDNYDLIVNTAYSKTEELADIIIEGEKCYREKQYFPKHWKSPALFLPSQKLGETLTTSPLGFSLEEIAESIKDNGYDYRKPINAIEADDMTVLQDGHHRCISAILAGNTLMPYEIEEQSSRKNIYSEINLSNMYDWEDAVKYYAKKGNNDALKEFNISKLTVLDKIIGWAEGR